MHFGFGFFGTATAEVVVREEVNQRNELSQFCCRLYRIETWVETMTKRQSSLIDQLSEDDVEDHPKEDYCDSDEYLREIDEEVPNEVTDTRNEPVPSTSNKSFGFTEPIEQDFVVGEAVFQAVLLFSVSATFEILQLNS